MTATEATDGGQLVNAGEPQYVCKELADWLDGALRGDSDNDLPEQLTWTRKTDAD